MVIRAHLSICFHFYFPETWSCMGTVMRLIANLQLQWLPSHCASSSSNSCSKVETWLLRAPQPGSAYNLSLGSAGHACCAPHPCFIVIVHCLSSVPNKLGCYIKRKIELDQDIVRVEVAKIQ